MILDLLHSLTHQPKSKKRRSRKQDCSSFCDRTKDRNEKIVKYDSKCCDLTTVGTYCDALQFIVDPSNLPYSKCENFPKLIKSYIKAIGLDTFIKIAETIPIGTSGDRAVAINDAFIPYETYYYKGIGYIMRLTLTRTDGEVIYDSIVGTTDTDASELQLHTTRMEIQKASERTWGLAQRNSLSVSDTRFQYASIWIPNVVFVNSIGDLTPDTEVINFRFGYPISDDGKPLPNLA